MKKGVIKTLLYLIFLIMLSSTIYGKTYMGHYGGHFHPWITITPGDIYCDCTEGTPSCDKIDDDTGSAQSGYFGANSG